MTIGQRQQARKAARLNSECYICKSKDHWARECPQKGQQIREMLYEMPAHDRAIIADMSLQFKESDVRDEDDDLDDQAREGHEEENFQEQ